MAEIPSSGVGVDAPSHVTSPAAVKKCSPASGLNTKKEIVPALIVPAAHGVAAEPSDLDDMSYSSPSAHGDADAVRRYGAREASLPAHAGGIGTSPRLEPALATHVPSGAAETSWLASASRLGVSEARW